MWHEEIQQCVDKANAIAEEAEKCEIISLCIAFIVVIVFIHFCVERRDHRPVNETSS